MSNSSIYLFSVSVLSFEYSYSLVSYPEVSPSFLVAAALSVEVKSEEQAQGDEVAALSAVFA
ncbi:hypothetical protein Lalb_Chr00c21g0405571 (mitochondrion) [Lupinus albus]|uniref:Uncharacterized protein n=1 Tax=Lupinus albus TaxID=3870 RepID=A0A6A4MJ06_LUPAL|nr:hypothetical protein Lalb_Chr00c21g0405571 [Lupinus albus]